MKTTGYRWKVMITAMLLVGFSLPSLQVGAQTLPGAIHYWQANGNALDSVGSNNGNLIGGATYGPSPAGQAFDLTGSGDHVSMDQPFPPMNVGDDFTISLWMKMTSPSPNWGALFDTRKTSFYGFAIAVNPNGAPWIAGRCNNSDNSWSCSGSATTLGEWHHVAVVFNWATATVELYVDGALADSNSLSACTGFTVSDKIFLGLSSEMNPIYEFAGLIDEVQVYDRVLNSSEIGTLYIESPVPVVEQSWGSVKSIFR